MGIFVGLDEIKSEPEAQRYILNKCSAQGQLIAIYSYAAGIVVIPFLLRHSKVSFLQPVEYKILFGAASSIFSSYILAKFTKKICERQMQPLLNHFSVYEEII